MAYGTLQTDVINSSTGVFSTNNAYNGIAKAWVNYNGSGATIRNSFNVSSITVFSAGVYQVNFTTAMANANYAVACICSDDNTASRGINLANTSVNVTTTSFITNIFTNANPSVYCAIVMGS